jgi:hypothetical protein
MAVPHGGGVGDDRMTVVLASDALTCIECANVGGTAGRRDGGTGGQRDSGTANQRVAAIVGIDRNHIDAAPSSTSRHARATQAVLARGQHKFRRRPSEFDLRGESLAPENAFI